MTIAGDVDAEIRRLHFAEHWPIGTIAAQLAIHPDVVRRVIAPEGRAVPPPRPQLVDPFRGFIDEQLVRYPRLRATRLFDMMQERGYTGSVRTLREHVALVRPMPKQEAFLRIEPLVGEQAQVDWAHVGRVAVPGGERALWAFVIVLAYSRAMWAELVFDLTVHSLRRSLVRSGSYFGGFSRQWLFDNPKTVVLARHGDAIRFHPDLLDIAGQCRVQPRLCGVRKPNQKGRVERSIRYLRDRFFAGRTITGIESGNELLRAFLREIAPSRAHPRWRERSVADVFAEERLRLLPLPAPLPSVDLVAPVAVDKTASIRFDTNLYSVPPAYAGKTLTLVADDVVVRVLDADLEVARHPRSWGRRQLVEIREHREEILREKKAARDLKGRDRLHAALPGIDELYERWVDAGRNLGSMTAKTIKLLDLYGDVVLGEAVAEVLARGLHDPGALAQISEQRRRAADRPVPIEMLLGSHVPDRDVIPHNLESYDAKRKR